MRGRLAAGAGLALTATVVATAVAAPLTGDIPVNTATNDAQYQPRVAMQPGGAFLVAWEDEDADNGEVHVRRFDAQGAALTGVLNAATGAGLQDTPDIGTASDGSAVIAWEDFQNAPGHQNVLARRLA